METPQETLRLFQTLGPLFAVAAPLILLWVQKRDRLLKTKYFIDLVHAADELRRIREAHAGEDESVTKKIDQLLTETESEIRRTTDSSGLNTLLMFILGEAVLITLLFTAWSDSINNIFLRPSYDSGLMFLEGIFYPTFSRLLLLLVIISVSVFLTVRVERRMSIRNKRALIQNAWLMLLFNGFLVGSSLVVGLLLTLLDPIIPLW